MSYPIPMGSTSDRGRQFAKLRRRDEMGVPQLLEGETPPRGTFLLTGTAAGTYGGEVESWRRRRLSLGGLSMSSIGKQTTETGQDLGNDRVLP